MKYEYNNWVPKLKTFKSPRPFNVCFSIEDWQGDGFIRLTVAVLYRSVQVIVPFSNDKHHYQFDFNLMRRNKKS